jgi:flagellar hook-length control protein FliK
LSADQRPVETDERLEAEEAADDKTGGETEISTEDDDEAEVPLEAVALAGNVELHAERPAADGAEIAGDAQAADSSRGNGEGLEQIPGFEEAANAPPGAVAKTVSAGEPDKAADAKNTAHRPVRPEKAEKADETVIPPESFGQTASAEEQVVAAETAESAVAKELPEQDRLAAKPAAETGLEAAAAEVAALPSTLPSQGSRQKPETRERAEKSGKAAGQAEGREEPSEARKGRQRERLNLELRDFRTPPKADGAPAVEQGSTEHSGDRAAQGGREAEITVNLKSQAQSHASFDRENRPPVSFRETLARELHENLNGDIVRHAQVILKNSGEGLIRLSLKPEHLGNVKIHLEMAENKVVGKITVESGEALRAFEQERSSLEQAFRDSGYDGATLEMSLTQDGGQGGRQEADEAAPFFSGRLAARTYDAASGDASGSALGDVGEWLPGGVLPQVNVLA